jgi:hypothetical protein
VSVAEQIRAIAGAADEAEASSRLARLEAESGIPIAAFAAIAEIVTILMREEDSP